MKRKILLASALCVSALSAGAQSWLGDVNQMIDEGAFAKAQVVLDGLPQSEKDANKIRIDSLQQIMQRTRRDFSINPAVGLSLIHI